MGDSSPMGVVGTPEDLNGKGTSGYEKTGEY